MKHLWLFLVIAFTSLADARAAEEATVESRLREGLRTVTIQLRDAQNQVATLQATQTASDQKIKELTAKIDALNKQAIADRNTSTNMLAEVNTKLAEQTAVNQGLQTAIDKWRRSYTELTSFAQKKEIERAKLNDRVIKLDRQVQDQQIKNIQMYKLGWRSWIATRNLALRGHSAGS